MRIVFCIFCFVGLVYSAELTPYKRHHVALSSDNDAYFEPTNYDRYYTAGHNLSYTSKEWEDSPLAHLGLLSRLYESRVSSFGISLGQEIYTPNARFAPIPPKDDMPYGGYLYLNGMIQNRTHNFMEQLSLNLGTSGKASLAKEAQDFIHDLINYYPLPGWNSQIKDEFIANLYYKAIYRFDIAENIFDILPYSVLALGNAHTHFEFGARLRLGYGLLGDFGIEKATTNHIGSVSLNDSFRFYILGGIAGRVVGRNMFIQGNTIGGVQTGLDMNRFFYEAEFGALLGWRGISFAFAYSYRQKEFRTGFDSNYVSLRVEVSF